MRPPPPAASMCPSQRGFTLVEILVVLILTGLIVGILFQALSQVFRLQGQVGGEMQAMREDAMRSDWFRQLVQGLQPDYEDGKDKFQAGHRRMAGLTINPLSAGQGALTPFMLELQFDNRRGETLLRYGKGEDAPVLLAWPGDQGRFVFMDADGGEHEDWPPPMAKKNAQLPAAVRLEARRDGQPWALLAVPTGSDMPRRRPLDVFGNFLR